MPTVLCLNIVLSSLFSVGRGWSAAAGVHVGLLLPGQGEEGEPGGAGDHRAAGRQRSGARGGDRAGHGPDQGSIHGRHTQQRLLGMISKLIHIKHKKRPFVVV